jgi:hypothetical protein
MMARELCVALLHHPTRTREGDVGTTTITNLDLHDLARSARTYGAARMFVVHPVASQRLLAERLLGHWTHGSGKARIPDRAPALDRVEVVPSLDDAVAALGGRAACELWSTSAQPSHEMWSWAEGAGALSKPGKPVLLLFGTGWGLTDSVLSDCDVRLAPIEGVADDYNHLSVRAACAIALDRLRAPAARAAPQALFPWGTGARPQGT